MESGPLSGFLSDSHFQHTAAYGWLCHKLLPLFPPYSRSPSLHHSLSLPAFLSAYFPLPPPPLSLSPKTPSQPLLLL